MENWSLGEGSTRVFFPVAQQKCKDPPQFEMSFLAPTVPLGALRSAVFTGQKEERMNLQYSPLSCNSGKCLLGEDFQCERCSAVGRCGICQPQNSAGFWGTRSLPGEAQLSHASCERRISWTVGAVEHSHKALCPNEPPWSPDQKTTKAGEDQGYSLQCCRDFKIKEMRFLLLWALHALLGRYFNLSPFFTGRSALCLSEAQYRTWNLFDEVFFVVPWFYFSLNETVEGFFGFNIFFLLQILWYVNSLFHSFGNHLGMCSTLAVKRNKSVLLVTGWSCGSEMITGIHEAEVLLWEKGGGVFGSMWLQNWQSSRFLVVTA